MKSTRKAAFGGVALALACAMAFGAAPASADPPDGTYPLLAGSGSDTTQYVLNGLADEIPAIGSYDALNPVTQQPGGTIRTRSAISQEFDRPNGSGAGIRALTASINPGGGWTYGGVVITDQLDFARSSSGPSIAGTDLTYIPFAVDAVGYAYAGLGASSVPANLTTMQLRDIYLGYVTTFYDGTGTLRTYKPRLPQANSGTRSFFLSQLGLTNVDVEWIDPATYVQENDGTDIDEIGELVPFSIASWIAQDNSVVPNTIEDNDITLGSVNAQRAVVESALNPAFPYKRNVYNVVETARLSGAAPADILLQQTFAGSTSAVCQASSVITQYGFGTHSACGDTSNYKAGYPAP
jgi:ABC-type phosphate transport system substrate-binding protein